MPKFKKPKNACGLNLRAVIEGELMNAGFVYSVASKLANKIEKRIEDGPSDWLTLSNGTTFDKTWVPEGQEVPTYRPRVPEVPVRADSPVNGFSPRGEDLSLRNFLKDHPVPYDPKLAQSYAAIHAGHEERVAAHSKLETEIQEFENWVENK